MSNLPPLAWLRAFEAAGRTGSFKEAAAELSVSPSTISHQVRDLESLLGVPLFSRGHRVIELTEEGRNYLAPLLAGFELIRSASPSPSKSEKVFHIGAFPFLANEILTPGMPTLRKALRGHHIRLHTRTELQALMHKDPAQRLDVIVRYGGQDGRFPGFLSDKLFDIIMMPIVGPATPPVESVEQLLARPLIRVLGPFEGWQRWLEIFRPGQTAQRFSIETDSYHSAALAVARGEGVCMGILPYLSPWIEAGRVRALAQFSMPIQEQAAFVVYAPHNRTNAGIQAFADWLRNALA